MSRLFALTLLPLWAAHGGLAALAEQPPGYETAAARLVATTVTVRVLPSKSAAPAVPGAEAGGVSKLAAVPKFAAAKSKPDVDGVTICSGVSVAQGIVCTFAHWPSDSPPIDRRYRITLPDGEQAAAELRLVDRYSGLSLLEIGKRDLPVLELAAETPAVGSAVLTAAAAGIERPAVSLGIVAAVDRSLSGTGLPPLVQCDIQTTESSAGAALVNAEGKLLGVIAATPAQGQAGGWSYAVPARHVGRLLEARQGDRLVVLERRRPSVGLTMGAGKQEGTVMVERVEPGGPADKAGIRAGDFIVEAEGRKIRSAYQAVDLILSRQPGDKLTLLVEQNNRRESREVTLAGTSEATPKGEQNADAVVGPQVNVRMVNPNQLEVRGGAGVKELELGQSNRKRYARTDEFSSLRAQVAAREATIARLQSEIDRLQRLQLDTDASIAALKSELDALRQQLREQQAAEPKR